MKPYDPVDHDGNEDAKAEKERLQKIAEEQEKSDFIWLMSSKRGRRIAWLLMEQAGVFRSSFNPNALQMAFAEGNRNYGLRTLSMIHAYCPEHYATMMRENTK